MLINSFSKFRNLSAAFFITCFLIQCADPSSIDASIVGKDEATVISTFKKPKSEKLIKLTKGLLLLEYESGLYKLYPNLQKGDTVNIKEIMWIIKGETIVVWFVKKQDTWVAIDYFSWEKGIQY